MILIRVIYAFWSFGENYTLLGVHAVAMLCFFFLPVPVEQVKNGPQSFIIECTPHSVESMNGVANNVQCLFWQE